MKITADFTKITGTVKPMHGIGQPPFLSPRSCPEMHYLADAGIPYARLHDMGGSFGGSRYVDIPNVFPDFDADETLPESYDFAFTDFLMAALAAQGCEPIYRLGVTIENHFRLKAYRIFPPADYHKWARICEHIVRHYNEGWADGFHYGITYWEIWNEPDDRADDPSLSQMWQGTPEEYFRLYEITANHLKACFGDSIRVGGYAATGWNAVGSKELNEDGTLKDPAPEDRNFRCEYLRDFLRWISSEEHRAPLDFFSWHCYRNVSTVAKNERYVEMMLEKYGFGGAEIHLNEWNPGGTYERRGTLWAAAQTFATMLALQKTNASVLNFYDGRIGASSYGGLFNCESRMPYPAYYTLMSFNEAFRLKNEVTTESDDPVVYVCGASDGKHGVLLLANTADKEREVEFELTGASLDDAYVLLLDAEHRYSPAGRAALKGGTLTMAANSCAEIRFEG